MEPESVKVVLLGEAGVGKTCIIKQFIEKKFDESTESSLSAQFVSKTIEYVDFGKTIKFDIWDTVGQEKFRSIAKIFYKDAKVIILVYDITSKKSFDALNNFWYDEIRNNCNDAVVLAVVGNKNDLYNYQQVDQHDAKDFAKKLGAIFQLTSAMTSDGIGLLFDNIGKKILKPNYKYDANNDIKVAEIKRDKRAYFLFKFGDKTFKSYNQDFMKFIYGKKDIRFLYRKYLEDKEFFAKNPIQKKIQDKEGKIKLVADLSPDLMEYREHLLDYVYPSKEEEINRRNLDKNQSSVIKKDNMHEKMTNNNLVESNINNRCDCS